MTGTAASVASETENYMPRVSDAVGQ